MTARRDFGHHLACALLVLGYAGAFPVWQALTARFGVRPMELLPFAAAVLVPAVLATLSLRRRPDWPPLLTGLLLILAVLALPDAQFPAKRIHVAEYLLMAALVRRTLGAAVQGPALAVLGTVMTALYGIHDEMIQGLLPDRSFGLRDVLVDALSGLAGTLVLHGLGLFPFPEPPSPCSPAVPVTPGLVLTGLGVLLLLIPLPAYPDLALPLWPVLPLLAGGFVRVLEPPPGHSGLARALDQTTALALGLALYPLLSLALGLPFR